MPVVFQLRVSLLPINPQSIIRGSVCVSFIIFPQHHHLFKFPWCAQTGVCSCAFFFFTMTFPPPGVWLVLPMEPTLACAFSLKSSFTFSIRTLPPPGNRTARNRRKASNPRGISCLQASTQGKSPHIAH